MTLLLVVGPADAEVRLPMRPAALLGRCHRMISAGNG
jgi:hypothetical protein